MPSRADVDPGDIKGLLSNVLLIDVARDPLDFRYRLIGTTIDEHSAESHTGQWISDIPERAPPGKVWDNLAKVVETRRPSRLSVPYVGPHHDFLSTEQIVLPLSDDDDRVNMLLCLIDYVRKT